MEVFVVSFPPIRPPTKRLEDLIQERKRSPVQTGSDVVDALPRVALVISASLHDIDLPAQRPRSVRVVHRQHPNGRPYPVTLGHLRDDLDFAESNVGGSGRVLCYEARGLDRVDDCASRTVGHCATGCRVCAGAVGEVESETVENCISANDIGSEGRDEVENAIFNEGVVR